MLYCTKKQGRQCIQYNNSNNVIMAINNVLNDHNNVQNNRNHRNSLANSDDSCCLDVDPGGPSRLPLSSLNNNGTMTITNEQWNFSIVVIVAIVSREILI
jgi:hypothetical protein